MPDKFRFAHMSQVIGIFENEHHLMLFLSHQDCNFRYCGTICIQCQSTTGSQTKRGKPSRLVQLCGTAKKVGRLWHFELEPTSNVGVGVGDWQTSRTGTHTHPTHQHTHTKHHHTQTQDTTHPSDTTHHPSRRRHGGETTRAPAAGPAGKRAATGAGAGTPCGTALAPACSRRRFVAGITQDT